jgi:hypothetical protein
MKLLFDLRNERDEINMKIVCDCGNEGEFKVAVFSPEGDETYLDDEKFYIEYLNIQIGILICQKCKKKIYF